MKVLLGFIMAALVSLVLPAPGGGSEGMLKVDEMDFCAAVRDREPVGAAEAFPSDIARVTCFTKIVGAEDTVSVEHVWYFGDREMARVELAVRSPSWRTWSTKTMTPEWAGEWRVDVVESDTTVIASKEFTLE
jgi:hypothetical protein